MIDKSVYRVAVLPGDGIGPDVVQEAVKALDAARSRVAIGVEFAEFSVGAGEYLTSGDPLPAPTLERVKEYDAILLGAMGLPQVRWPTGVEMTPQIELREKLDLYCGLRPIYLFHPEHTPLKRYAAGEIDFVIVRESTEGLFSSRLQPYPDDAAEVVDRLRITRAGSLRLFRAAFELARRRRRKVTLVDKANVLPSMAFFRRLFDQVSRGYPDVATERVYVDALSLYLVERPHSFDVLVTENMFGDIISDLAAALVGGMGMAPSADIGDRWAVFQPSHGSAPDIAGRGIANPVATILSAAMMLEWWDTALTNRAARLIHDAVREVLRDASNRTRDLGGSLSTAEMGDRITAAIRSAEA